jgi:hypothetical protein
MYLSAMGLFVIMIGILGVLEARNRRMYVSLVLSAILILMGLVVTVLSVSNVVAAKPAKRPKQVFTFKTDNILGDRARVDYLFIRSRKNIKFKNLWKPRRDFRKKLIRSINSL